MATRLARPSLSGTPAWFRRFYQSPFTDLSPQGPDALFESAYIDRLVQVLSDVRHNAEVA